MLKTIAKLFKNNNTLQSEANAQTALLKSEFAQHINGMTPQRLAQIFREAEQGYLTNQCDLFEDMEERDGHLMAELSKRKRALLGLPWAMQAPRNATAAEQQLTDFFQEYFTDLTDFEDLILNLADAIGYGFACLEIEWQFNGEYWLPKQFHKRPARWFKLPQQDRDSIRLRDNSQDGAELMPAGWLVHTHHAKSGDLSRAGLLRALAFPYLYKHYSARDLAEFLEIYGLPLRLGKYQSGASDKEKATLMQAVVNIGHNAAGIIPEGMTIEFMEAAKGSSDPHLAMIDWCERTQSKIILGGTLTSDTGSGGGGAYALGNVHNEVRRDLLVSDAVQIQNCLTHSLVNLIATVNGWLADGSRCPRFVFDVVEGADLALYADALPKLVGIGVQVPVAYIQDKLRIPLPKEGEAVLGMVAKPSVAALSDSRVGLSQPRFTANQQVIEDNVSQLLSAASSPISEQAIKTAIMAATSPDDLADRLAVLIGSDSAEFEAVLAKAMFAADALGYVHAN